jgi:hypothetical protein
MMKDISKDTGFKATRECIRSSSPTSTGTGRSKRSDRIISSAYISSSILSMPLSTPCCGGGWLSVLEKVEIVELEE